ncbi:MAG: LexA family transcriptional regulator [Weeksellaceae bacterium]|nr:LexA family transcriptional regulator [Weeksellaceae bacterium]
MALSIEQQRFREVREQLGYTQTKFAEMLGIGSSTADIERGKVKLPGQAVMELMNLFQINPLWLYDKSAEKTIAYIDSHVMPKILQVNNQLEENILLVPIRAAAGYGANIGDEEFYENLPAFSIPLPAYRNASFRGFQISGESMIPGIQPEEWVIAKALENISQIKDGNIYVIVEADSVRIKRIFKESDTLISLVSDNPEFPPVQVPISQILEIWEYHSKITTATDANDINLQTLYRELQEIKRKIDMK